MSYSPRKTLSVLILSGLSLKAVGSTNCRPSIDLEKPQFVIGYGSLMWEGSKNRSGLRLDPNQPIELRHFFRGWIQEGNSTPGQTSYLGVIPHKNGLINAVYFAVPHPEDIAVLDEKESIHCRMEVPRNHIKSLGKSTLPKGQYWIYTTDNLSHHPSIQYPMLQSYMDNFLSGCLALEKQYKLKNFTHQCIQTTGHWSRFWINDRKAPRTPFTETTYVIKIDKLLHSHFPEWYEARSNV